MDNAKLTRLAEADMETVRGTKAYATACAFLHSQPRGPVPNPTTLGGETPLGDVYEVVGECGDGSTLSVWAVPNVGIIAYHAGILHTEPESDLNTPRGRKQNQFLRHFTARMVAGAPAVGAGSIGD